MTKEELIRYWVDSSDENYQSMLKRSCVNG